MYTQPLALVTWGCRLTMSYVHKEAVVEFIRVNALRGPEQIGWDGGYDYQLIEKSETNAESDTSDKLCSSVIAKTM